VWKRWRDAQAVLLDDVGCRDTPSDARRETLKRALDLREGQPTILTANLTPAGLARVYDDRLASRCCAGTVVKVQGPDRRLAK
jgi:chromosomal replication initiation ATPase DnaA